MGLLSLFKPKAEFKDDLAAMVNEEYARRQAERRPFELQWRLNIEFINGNQYMDIDPLTQSVSEVPRLFWHQERNVFNQIATIHESRIARLTRQRPFLKTRPASSDDSDISSAKVSTMLLAATWHDQDMNIKYSEFVNWLESTGSCFWKPSWSVNKGRLIYRGQDPSTQASMMGQMPGQMPTGEMPAEQAENPTATAEIPVQDPQLGEQMMKDAPIMEIREGDVDTCVVPPFEIFPDSCYRARMDLCRSVIHAKAFHINEIEEIWGQKVDPEEVEVMTMQTGAVGGSIGQQFGGIRGKAVRMKNHAVVKEYYELPTKQYPMGRMIVVANKTLLYVGAMPYQLGQDGTVDYPIIRCVSIERAGCLFGSSVVERCIPVQRRYNAWRNRKAEYLNLVVVGQWYEPIGSLDDGVELNNEPGSVIRYRPGGLNGAKPEPVQYPNLPASYENEGAILMQEFTAISGVSEMSRFSESPTGLRSGRALGIVDDQDNTRISITSTYISNSVIQLGKCWIRLFRQFVQEPRVLRTVGANRDVEVRDWSVSDLKSDDIIVENVTSLTETPAQRRAFMFDLINAQLFVRPELSPYTEETRRRVFELIEFGHWESEGEDMYWLQRNRARRENLGLTQQGQMPALQDYDDDAIHIQEHYRDMMQSDYEQLLQTPIGPVIDMMYKEHVAQHQMRLAQKQAAAMAAQAQQEGAPADKPPAT